MSTKWKISGHREFNYICDYANQNRNMRSLSEILEKHKFNNLNTEKINDEISSWAQGGRGGRRSDSIDLMFKHMLEDLIDIKRFGWIDKNDPQVCLFIIHQIINDIDKKLDRIAQNKSRERERERERERLNDLLDLLDHVYQQSSYPLMYPGILLFIDCHDFHNAKELNSQRSRIDYLHSLKKKWSELTKELSDIDWLEQKNDVQANWAINYVEKNTDLYIPELNPVSSEEKIISVIGAIQIADLHPAEKREILARMKSAWGSKKNRSDGKKNINYRIDPDVFQQFEKLCKKKNIKKNIMLEELISQEYERSFGKRR